MIKLTYLFWYAIVGVHGEAGAERTKVHQHKPHALILLTVLHNFVAVV